MAALPAEGRGGVEAPADAPREVSQPLTDDYYAQAQARARTNERQLEPLRVPTGPGPGPDPGLGGAPGEVKAPAPVQAADPAYPAGSNSDGPSRGIPGTAPRVARGRAPLPVVGGFGEGPAEYYPLDGREVKALVESLMDEVHAQMQNDLRFHLAVTYPRVRATVTVRIEGEADDAGVTIEKVKAHDRTAREVAEAHGDSVVFVITRARQEFDAAGEVDAPPDAMREALGLPVPHKRRVPGPAGQVADVSW